MPPPPHVGGGSLLDCSLDAPESYWKSWNWLVASLRLLHMTSLTTLGGSITTSSSTTFCTVERPRCTRPTMYIPTGPMDQIQNTPPCTSSCPQKRKKRWCENQKVLKHLPREHRNERARRFEGRNRGRKRGGGIRGAVAVCWRGRTALAHSRLTLSWAAEYMRTMQQMMPTPVPHATLSPPMRLRHVAWVRALGTQRQRAWGNWGRNNAAGGCARVRLCAVLRACLVSPLGGP